MSFESRDDFWNIEKLVPAAKKQHPRFKTEKETAIFEIKGEEKSKDNQITLLRTKKSLEESSYVPLCNPLIQKITVRSIKGGYDFYESFRKCALLYYDVVAQPSSFVAFYSYMPQYSQMTEEQKNYYFYLRSEIRKGNYSLRADISYLYLYVYEILNLPEKIPPEVGISLLCELWKRYRKALPAMDRYFSVWVQDYCIVHRLQPPTALIEDFIFDIIEITSFREFYLGGIYTESSAQITALLSCFSDYDWRTGRYAGGESREIYRRHIEGAMRPVLRALWDKGAIFLDGAETERLSRDAFPCSLCTHSVKCRIEIDYHPLGRADELRDRVTGALKYAENQLRAAMSVKSRLSVKNLHDEDKALIDAYFLDIFRAVNQKRRLLQREEYEYLYDAPRQEMSFSGADDIEQSSWQNTAMLVEACGEMEEGAFAPAIEVAPQKEEVIASTLNKDAEATDVYVRYLSALLYADVEGKSAAVRDAQIPEESLAEKINELFYSEIGDVVISFSDFGCVLIEDYREDVSKWLTAQK